MLLFLMKLFRCYAKAHFFEFQDLNSKTETAPGKPLFFFKLSELTFFVYFLEFADDRVTKNEIKI